MFRPRFLLWSILLALVLFVNVGTVNAASKPVATPFSAKDVGQVKLVYTGPFGWGVTAISVGNLRDELVYECKVTAAYLEIEPLVEDVLKLVLTPASNTRFHFGVPDTFVYVEFATWNSDRVLFWFALDRFARDKLIVNGNVVNMEPALLNLVTCLLPKHKADEFEKWKDPIKFP